MLELRPEIAEQNMPLRPCEELMKLNGIKFLLSVYQTRAEIGKK